MKRTDRLTFNETLKYPESIVNDSLAELLTVCASWTEDAQLDGIVGTVEQLVTAANTETIPWFMLFTRTTWLLKIKLMNTRYMKTSETLPSEMAVELIHDP